MLKLEQVTYIPYGLSSYLQFWHQTKLWWPTTRWKLCWRQSILLPYSFLCSKEIGLSYRLMPGSQAATTCKLGEANKDLWGFPAKSQSTLEMQRSYKAFLWFDQSIQFSCCNSNIKHGSAENPKVGQLPTLM